MAKLLTAEDLYNKLKNVKLGAHLCTFDMEKCEEILPMVNEIIQLKEEKNAIILAHSYVAPEITYGVADFMGDSYGLSKNAMESDADIIIFSAVTFMGETAKILNPTKDVYVPATDGGCSLADSITAEDMHKLKAKYPEHTFICYINTTAEIKALCDVCVTSSNVYDIVENYPSDKIVFVPDLLMGQNILDEMKKRGVNKGIVLYEGTCYVHEQYDPEMIEFLRNEHQGLQVVSHPECTIEVASRSDYVGSTGQMMDYIKDSDQKNFLLLTECGLSSRLQIENPDKNFIGSCQMCKYMKSNSLENILNILKNPSPQDRIDIAPDMIEKSKTCIERMFEYAEASKNYAPNPCE